jgi:hypothetical protein
MSSCFQAFARGEMISLKIDLTEKRDEGGRRGRRKEYGETNLPVGCRRALMSTE